MPTNKRTKTTNKTSNNNKSEPIIPLLYHRPRAPSSPLLNSNCLKLSKNKEQMVLASSLTNLTEKMIKTTQQKIKTISNNCLNFEVANSEEYAMEFCQEKLKTTKIQPTTTIKQQQYINLPNLRLGQCPHFQKLILNQMSISQQNLTTNDFCGCQQQNRRNSDQQKDLLFLKQQNFYERRKSDVLPQQTQENTNRLRSNLAELQQLKKQQILQQQQIRKQQKDQQFQQRQEKKQQLQNKNLQTESQQQNSKQQRTLQNQKEKGQLQF